MDWKVGDYFYIEEQKPFYEGAITPGNFYKVKRVGRGTLSYIGNNGSMFNVGICSRIKKRLILDNPLNRKLYPNRIEKDGYLIPKDTE